MRTCAPTWASEDLLSAGDDWRTRGTTMLSPLVFAVGSVSISTSESHFVKPLTQLLPCEVASQVMWDAVCNAQVRTPRVC